MVVKGRIENHDKKTKLRIADHKNNMYNKPNLNEDYGNHTRKTILPRR